MKQRQCTTCSGQGSLSRPGAGRSGRVPCNTCGGAGFINLDQRMICYSIHSTSGELIRIEEGVLGFYHIKSTTTHLPVKGAEAIELKQMLNESLGISNEEELHMVGGSMFGWHLEGVKNELKNTRRIARMEA